MADVADVVAALCGGVDAILYPNGDGQAPILGTAITISDGWPLPQDLDRLAADFNAVPSVPRGWVTVWPLLDEQNRDKYSSDWGVLTAAPAPGLTVTIDDAGTVATIGGTVPGNTGAPTNIGLLVDGTGYPYRVLASDTVDTIAAALAALLPDDRGASASGAAVSVPAAYQLEGRVGTFATLARETRRQGRTFQIVVWAGADALREQIAAAIDLVYSDRQWLALPDGTGGRIRYRGSPLIEDQQKNGLYGRALRYEIEYPTIVTALAAELLFPTAQIQGGFVGVDGPFGPQISIAR